MANGDVSWDSIGIATEEIGRWAEKTFDHTNDGILRHLIEEANELRAADDSGSIESAIDNCADVAILLLTYCYRNGVDLSAALRNKHKTNLKRTWRFDEKTSLTRHD